MITIEDAFVQCMTAKFGALVAEDNPDLIIESVGIAKRPDRGSTFQIMVTCHLNEEDWIKDKYTEIASLMIGEGCCEIGNHRFYWWLRDIDDEYVIQRLIADTFTTRLIVQNFLQACKIYQLEAMERLNGQRSQAQQENSD